MRSQGPLARIRPVAGPLLLVLFVAGAEIVPAVHLATHKNDHTHGPALDPDDPDHDHGDDGGADRDGPTWLAALFGGHHHHDDAVDDDHDHDADHQDADHHGAAPVEHGPAGHHHDVPGGDHGQGSSAHFLLALVDGPPPPFLPPPSETLAPAPDTPCESWSPAPLPQPPARGPPRLA